MLVADARGARILIASDWHLGTYSPPAAGHLAMAFLWRAGRAGDVVVLNGDIFEGIFEPTECAERAHPDVVAQINTMARHRQLWRTCGNHDPRAGELSILIERTCIGRVLVTHGHRVDPLHTSALGGLGDSISRKFGRLAVVRGGARVAEAALGAVASAHVDRMFRRRGRGVAERNDCGLAVFGHIHRPYLKRGDRYANAGSLKGDRLEFVTLGDRHAELGEFRLGAGYGP